MKMMKKFMTPAIIVLVVLVLLFVAIEAYNNKEKRDLVDSVYEKWNKIATRKGRFLDADIVKGELAKLSNDELVFINDVSQMVLDKDYWGIVENIQETRAILAETDLSKLAFAVIFQT